MATLMEVLQHGNVIVQRGKIKVTAAEHTLCAWRETDNGFVWLATRAGSAGLFKTALELQQSAERWVDELIKTGRA